jgi:asparagine synthase (glutamine-hydrolysing)
VHHILAFIWDPADGAATAASRRLVSDAKCPGSIWKTLFCEPGLTVLERPPFTGSTDAQLLPKGAGVVLGRVFPKNLESWKRGWTWDVTENEVEAIIQTKGRSMIEKIWGGYIAFLYDSSRRSVYVIRDCSGKVPCYRTQHFGVDIVFSDLDDVRALNLPTFTINLRYVTAFLCASQLQIRDCGLNEVAELLAGDCFKVESGQRSQLSLWNPVRAFNLPPIDDFDVATADIRFTFQRCVDAWASAFGRICVSLSGGLDSAVVLGCLRRTRDAGSLVCVNRYGPGEGEDERVFARAAATAAGVELQDFPFFPNNASFSASLYGSALTPKPTIPWAFANLDMDYHDSLARDTSIDSIWTGQGGDHLFLQTRSPLGARDYLELNGFNRGLLQAVMDTHRLSGEPYLATIRTLTSKTRACSGGLNALNGSKSVFLCTDAQSGIAHEYLTNPWMEGTEHLSPGRRFQVAALTEVLNRHRPLPGFHSAYEHHPMLSQPLVELCLRIPSYVHLRAGVTRAVEKAAFDQVVPTEILARERKGQSTMSALECLHRSEGFIRELLLDGILVHEKILDRRTMEPLLNHKRPMRLTDTFPLVSCVAAELWVRTWANSRAFCRRQA